jgi:hypothetical protein
MLKSFSLKIARAQDEFSPPLALPTSPSRDHSPQPQISPESPSTPSTLNHPGKTLSSGERQFEAGESECPVEQKYISRIELSRGSFIQECTKVRLHAGRFPTPRQNSKRLPAMHPFAFYTPTSLANFETAALMHECTNDQYGN